MYSRTKKKCSFHSSRHHVMSQSPATKVMLLCLGFVSSGFQLCWKLFIVGQTHYTEFLFKMQRKVLNRKAKSHRLGNSEDRLRCKSAESFYISLTVHLGIFLVNNQLDALFQMYLFISLLSIFRATQCSPSGESNCINTSSVIQGVPRLQGITAGGDFLGLCDEKSSYKHVSDFGLLRSYDRLKLRIEGNDY